MKLVETYLSKPPEFVYHGSKTRAIKNFEYRSSFRYTFATAKEVKCNGFFFALNAHDAAQFGRYVSAYKITCNKPLISGEEGVDRVSPQKAADFRYIFAALLEEVDDEIYEFQGLNHVTYIKRSDLEDPSSEWFYEFIGAGYIDWEYLDNTEFVKRMKERGYDSTVVYESGTISMRSWFVVSPEQIEFVQEIESEHD